MDGSRFQPSQDTLGDRLAEFNEFVWIHTADAFQQQFDTATDIPDDVIAGIKTLLFRVDEGYDEEQLSQEIIRLHDELGIPFYAKLIQLVGLTRNKLVTDVDALARAADVRDRPPRTFEAIPRKQAHWPLAARELASRFRTVFSPSAAVSEDDDRGVIQTVNLATWPGYIRQERAKRSGHEAEARLARICKEVGIPFAPTRKAEQDIAADVQVGSESFDLVFPDSGRPRACVISTVHTANIEQYGESKDAGDIARAKSALAEVTGSPILIALADGLGFRSNRAGLEGVLRTAEEFCQFRTLWKAVVIAGALTQTGRLRLWLPDPERFEAFFRRYGETLDLLVERPDEGIEAGDGIFVLD